MANDEHLKILRQGVDLWNKLKVERPSISDYLSKADFRNANLREAHLSGVNLNDVNLRDAILTNAELNNASLTNAILTHANLSYADLRDANLSKANLINANLCGANLNGANLRGAELRGAKLHHATLNDVDLRDAILTNADLGNADLSNAFLSHAEMRNANLSGASLYDAVLNDATLINVNLSDANLSGADLKNIDLSKANLSNVDLSDANLRRANLNEAVLRGASLYRVFTYGTIFTDLDLREVKGLETVEHLGPSEIGISTIYRSEGKIPEIFLRGCGVPREFIVHITKLVAVMQSSQFYSCFISYSNKDEEFARHLHARMRESGLRVWFADEDVKGGEKLSDQIDLAIQDHDRVLLVLSENSLKSNWVMTEIRRAHLAEVKETRRKLFPIRLMDYDTLRSWKCFDADHGKDLAVEIREYFIPDFSNWKNPDDFEKAFSRLLSDLKASTR